MGIIVDLVIIFLILLSTFLGYKKGLIALGIQLIAFVVSLTITFILYKPIGNLIINATSIDEKLQQTIEVNLSNFLSENNENGTENMLIENVEEGMLPETSRILAINIIYIVTMLVLFIISRICLLLIKSMSDFITNLPIIKQFNKVGGTLYGLLRGFVACYVVLMIVNLIIIFNPKSFLTDIIDKSYLSKSLISYNILSSININK